MINQKILNTQPSPATILNEMIDGYRTSKLISVVARLGIADILKTGQKNIEELATCVDVHPRALYRVLRVLASKGIFAETNEGYFTMTPLAEPLRSDVRGSLHPWAIATDEPWLRCMWDELMYSVKTEKPAFEHIHGVSFWEYLEQDKKANNLFNEAMMQTNALYSIGQCLSEYDFSGVKTVVDVAGGQGNFLSAILKKYPTMHGILLDTFLVIEEAKHIIQLENLEDRCTLIVGDMFKAIPKGGDIYLLKWIIHNWDDEHAINILKKCRKAMKKNSRLLLVDTVILTGNEQYYEKILDIVILVSLRGRERTEDEFRFLLETAGFKLMRVIQSQSSEMVLEAQPI